MEEEREGGRKDREGGGEEKERRKGREGGRGRREMMNQEKEKKGDFKNPGDLLSGKVLRYRLVFRRDW